MGYYSIVKREEILIHVNHKDIILKRNKPVTKTQILCDSYTTLREVKFLETESRRVGAGGCGRVSWGVRV